MADGIFDLNVGALEPVADEIIVTELEVSGTIPAELSGLLLRNGPNPFEGFFVGNDMLAWWMAPAMVHGLSIVDGVPQWYRNRWVGREDDETQNTNVNVIEFAGKLLALGEGTIPNELSPELDQIGSTTLGGAVPNGMTAHPKVDAETGELMFLRSDWQEPFLTYGVLDAQGRTTHNQIIEIPGPAMMHDFAITERHSIFLDLQVAYDFSLLEHGIAAPLRWHDDRQSRIGIVPRHGGDVVWFEIEPCFIQHIVNAYESQTDTIVLDAVRYPSFLVFAGDAFLPNPLGVLWRYTFDLVTCLVTETEIDSRAVDLPRINEMLTGRRAQFAYMVEQPTNTEMRGIVKYDLDSGATTNHAIAPGNQNSEPVFVPRPKATAEDDGWLLVCVYLAATHTTDVVILDAADVAAPPVATVHLPRHIPAGFHGAWIPTPT